MIHIRVLLGLAASLSLLGCNDNFSYTKIPSSASLQFASPSQSLVSKAMGQSFDVITSFDIGKQPFGSTSKSTVYLQNTGDLSATVQQMWIDSGANSSYFTIQDTCPQSISSSASPCAVNILYSPNTVGETPVTLHVRYDDGHGSQPEVQLPIQAVANNLAYLKFEASSIDVQNDTIGYSVNATFKVLYNGASASAAGLSIQAAQGITISDPNDPSFVIDRSSATTCGDVINQNCVISVKFSARAVGQASGSFNVSYFNGSQVQSMQGVAMGTGTAAVTLASLSGSPLNMGSVVVQPRAPHESTLNIAFTGSVPADNVNISLANMTSDVTISTDSTKTTCLAGKLTSGGSISGNCALTLEFNPSVRQAYANSVIISYTSHGQSRPQTIIPLSGNGVNPAVLAVTTSNSLDFASVPAHKTVSKTYALQNNGEVAISNLSAVTLSDSTDYKTAFDSACATLAAGAKCNLTVSFKPNTASAPSAFSSTFSFTYDDGRAVQTVSGLSATGIGTAPLDMEFSSPGGIGGLATIDFGNVMIGNSVLPTPKVATLGVFGTTPMSTASQLVITPSTLSSPFTFVGGAFPGTGQSCKTPFDPNKSSSCTFSVGLVAFGSVPADTPITQNFNLSYTGDNANGSGTLAFQAKMTPRNPPAVNFVIAPSGFPTVSVNGTSSLTFKLQNVSPYFGTTYKSISVMGDPSFTIASSTCSTSLAANATCTVTVNFKPTTAGTFTGTLAYTYNNQISDQVAAANFSGTGSANVTLAASSTTVDFGTVYIGDTVAPKTIALSYLGSSSWTSSATPPAQFGLDSSACGPASGCNLVFSLNPTVAGSTVTTMDFNYSPGLPSPAKITFTLKANVQYRSPTMGVNGTSFGKVLVGQSATQTVTIVNSGNGTANAFGFPALSGVFSYTSDGAPGTPGSCAQGQSLASGQSCSLKVKFTPNAVGSAQVPFSVTYTNAAQGGTSSANASLTGTGTQLIQIFAGAYQTCMINELGSAVCWGRNSSGQAGIGNVNSITAAISTLSPISFGSGVQVVKLAVGDSHTCALINTSSAHGKVTCWGNNESGRLGLGVATAQVHSPLETGSLMLVDLGIDPATSSAEIATDIAAGFEHTCAVLKSGRLKCWGGNTSGQLGNGNTNSVGTQSSQMGNALVAVNLGGLSAVSVSAGAGHTCAVLSDSSTKCWGDNYYGQLGQGVATDKIGISPSDFTSLKSIALGADGSVSQIFASAGAYTCALLNNGSIKCFGHTAYGESSGNPYYGILGNCFARAVYNSAATLCSAAPGSSQTTALGYFGSDMGDNLVEVPLSAKVSELGVGSNFNCAILADKTLRCWGSNDRGQLGTGTSSSAGNSPSEMGANLRAALGASVSGANAVSVATGYSHACAVISDNTLRCWGASQDNATGLAAEGITSDAGAVTGTSADALPIVYDARR